MLVRTLLQQHLRRLAVLVVLVSILAPVTRAAWGVLLGRILHLIGPAVSTAMLVSILRLRLTLVVLVMLVNISIILVNHPVLSVLLIRTYLQ